MLFAYDYHPQYQLVVAANRDEFYTRPTLPAAFWSDHPAILAGKDLQEGGTWMGISTTGRWAGLTNYRDPSSYKPQSPSRGHLVQNYLCSNDTPQSYIEHLDNGGAAYNGCNLLLGNHESLSYYSNREKLIRKVEKGVHGLSNSLLDVPWPKVTGGKKDLTDVLQNEDIKVDRLFAIMADRKEAPDQDLPQTGVSLEMERMLAPAYVLSQDYGTRTTTVILIDRKRRVQFWERSFVPRQPDRWDEVHYEFQIKLSTV